MEYHLETWRSGTSQRGLSVPVAAGLLADGETIIVGVIATSTDSSWLEKGEPVPGMSLTLWENPLAGQDGEPAYVMRWASGTLMTPGLAEAEVLGRAAQRAAAIAAFAEKLLAGEADGPLDEEEPAEFDLAAVLTSLAVTALRSPQGTSPGAAAAMLDLKRHLGIDGTTSFCDALAAVRGALEAGHADA